jgi:hypothetical protein
MESIFEATFPTGANPEEILPQDALSTLPFAPQSITTWAAGSDLHTFIYKLLAGTGFEEQADERLAGAIEQALDLADLFTETATQSTPAPGAKTQAVEVLDFTLDPVFGRLAKALIAWQETIGNILSEAGYFSLSHMLETRSDLMCSVQLAGGLYYRQSMQVLRGFIESVILPIYFCRQPELFKKWKANEYQPPSIRGKDGVLSRLNKAGVISDEMEMTISDAYSLLNGYIHGSEEKLNNAGLDRGEWEGHIFQPARFEAWALVCTSLIEASLPLVKINLSQWATARSNLDLFCNVCHGHDLETKQQRDEPPMTQFQCKQCSHTFWRDEDDQEFVHTTVELLD